MVTSRLFIALQIFLLITFYKQSGAATIIADWPFDRTVDGVEVTDGQIVPEGDTAGLFDASGNHALGRAIHYRGITPSAPGAGAIYTAYKSSPHGNYDRCALNTTYGGVYFPDGSPQLKTNINFSVWTQFQPLNTNTTETEIILGRSGSWLICRNRGRLAAGIVNHGKLSNIDDVFDGHGPVLKTSHWYDVGFSIGSEQGQTNDVVRVYLNGKPIKQAEEKAAPDSNAPFQIAGRSGNASFPESRFFYQRVIAYSGVIKAEAFASLHANGGPQIDTPPATIETLTPTYWWSAGGQIGKASNYQPLCWRSDLGAYCAGLNTVSTSNEMENTFYLKPQRKLFTTQMAPEQGYFGTNSVNSSYYPIVTYTVPRDYNQNLELTGPIYLHDNKGQPAAGSNLKLLVYVNDNLKSKQIIASEKEAAMFSANLGKIKPGNRIYVEFHPMALGRQNQFWFDYKLNLQSFHSVILPKTIPVAAAFHVDTTKPFPPDSGWMYLHYQFCNYAQQYPVNLLFIGDSITAAWGIKGRGREVWDERLSQYQPANFGIAGQTTQDVLWRIGRNELGSLHPKAVVVMLGCNDINWPADEIAAGITEVVRQVRDRLPDSIVILMGILPRGRQPNTIERSKIDEANTLLAKLDDGIHVHFVNFGNKLLSPDGTLSKQMSLDSIHPTTQGYVFWADAIQPFLDRIFGTNPIK